MIWIGLGTPKQAILATAAIERLGLATVCVAAVFDFLSRAIEAAPHWLQGSGFECRLWRRYTLENVRFLWVAAREARRGSGR